MTKSHYIRDEKLTGFSARFYLTMPPKKLWYILLIQIFLVVWR